MVKQIFEITDEATDQIKKASEVSESSEWPLRISLSVDDNGKFNYLMGFDQSKEEDLQLKINGINILIDPNSMIKLKNTKLDYVKLDGNDKQFIFINPNDPEHKKPDESLDSNTTHEFN
jgi:iron-sulfur cluster assembly protein